MFFNCGAVSILLMVGVVVVVVVVVVGEKVFMLFGKKEEYTIFMMEVDLQQIWQFIM